MSCTTYKIVMKDPLLNENWTRYCNLLMKIRLARVSPGINFPKTKHCYFKQKAHKPMNDLQKRNHSTCDSRRHTKGKIAGSQYSKKSTDPHTRVFLKNRKLLKENMRLLETQRLKRENNCLRKRLTKVGSTIDVRSMHRKERQRQKILANMSKFNRKSSDASRLVYAKRLVQFLPASSRRELKRNIPYIQDKQESHTARF